MLTWIDVVFSGVRSPLGRRSPEKIALKKREILLLGMFII